MIVCPIIIFAPDFLTYMKTLPGFGIGVEINTYSTQLIISQATCCQIVVFKFR